MKKKKKSMSAKKNVVEVTGGLFFLSLPLFAFMQVQDKMSKVC